MTGPEATYMPDDEYLAEYDRALANYDIVLGRDNLTAEERVDVTQRRADTLASREEAAARLAQGSDPSQGG